MADRFELCREKIRRAEARLSELEVEVRAFFEGNEPYDIPGDYDAETKTFTFYFKTRRHPPAVLDAIIGEIAHGPRSSLNNLAATLSGTPDANIDFPIFSAKPSLPRRAEPGSKKLRPEHRAAIECLQPYQRAQPDEAPLAIINRLARIDKHREGTFKTVANVLGITTSTLSATSRAMEPLSCSTG